MCRQKRKSNIFDVGREQFGFDRRVEFVKYKYLCCEGMSQDEWLQCNNFPCSYYEWSEKIKHKYEGCNIQQLEEFKRYLELCIRKEWTNQESNNIIYAAMVASALTVIFDGIIIPYVTDLSLLSNCALGILACIGVVILVMFSVSTVYFNINKCNLEKNMYSDYKEIIERIIVDKKKASSHQK